MVFAVLRLILAAELVRLKVDVIVVTSLSPVGSGLVDSLAKPGGNVTGLPMLGVEIVGKQLALLKERHSRP